MYPLVVLVGIIMGSGEASGINRHVLKVKAETAMKALPDRVAHLFQWPDQATLAGPQRVRGDENGHIAYAKENSIEWIAKVLAPAWLPEDKRWLEDRLIMLRDAFGECDVTRVAWEKNGYAIQVSQMAGIIAIKLTPLEAKNHDTPEQKRAFAAELCSKVINSTGMRWGGEGQGPQARVPVKDLPKKILRYCFQPESVRQFTDGTVAGVCLEPSREQLEQRPRDREGMGAEHRADNPNWDESVISWGYWWRHVGWWCDGKSVGLFTLKTEAGTWKANYWDTMGSKWFEGEPFKPLKPVSQPGS